MNPFDARRALGQLRSPHEDRELLDSRPILDLNNMSLSGNLEDKSGYNPVPQNLTLASGHIHMPNMIQNVKIEDNTIREPVNGVPLRPGKIGNVLAIIDLALIQKKGYFADWL